MTEFIPVNFQDHYFSILNCYIQSVLLDFRFRTKSYQQIQQEYFGAGATTDAKKDQKNAADQKKNKKNDGKKGKADEKGNNPKSNKDLDREEEFRPETIAQYFFGNETGQLPS